MALCVNDSGTWREIPTLCVNNSGTWRETATGCINQSGTWRCFGFTPDVGGASVGDILEGGYLICKSGGIGWIIAPSSTEVLREWYTRNDAVTTANAQAACGDWFIPTCGQLQNPGYTSRNYWDYSPTQPQTCYWSSQPSPFTNLCALGVRMHNGTAFVMRKTSDRMVRAFRCVSY